MTNLDLDAFLEETVAPDVDLDTDEAREKFRLETDRMASWALLKLARAQQERDAIEATARERIETVNAWRTQALAGPDRDVNFFEGLLKDYALRRLHRILDELRADHPDATFIELWEKVKRKRLSLPEGDLSAVRSSLRVEIDNEQAFIDWAQATDMNLLAAPKPAGVTTLKERLNFNSDGAAVHPTLGELVPGIRAVAPDETGISITVTPTKLEQPAWLPPPRDP